MLKKKPVNNFVIEASLMTDKEIDPEILYGDLNMNNPTGSKDDSNVIDSHQENWSIIRKRYLKLNNTVYVDLRDFDINWVKYTALLLTIYEVKLEGIITIVDLRNNTKKYIQVIDNQITYDEGIYPPSYKVKYQYNNLKTVIDPSTDDTLKV